ncbi:UbiX family flavin prenyltransferase [bacterium]|nr:MAG: UbiX family flavin prenyltransferase [bacterium]
MRRIVVGITGASGSAYGIRLLEVLKDSPEIETHLILTTAGRKTLSLESGRTPEEVEALADFRHDPEDLAAPLSSGSFKVDSMVVVPCSMKSLSAIVNSYGADLLSRAADVTLKEGRKLILCPRETPLHKGHLKLMLFAAELGAVILPPMVAFYHKPKSVEEIVDHTVGRILDTLEVDSDLFKRWGA